MYKVIDYKWVKVERNLRDPKYAGLCQCLCDQILLNHELCSDSGVLPLVQICKNRNKQV